MFLSIPAPLKTDLGYTKTYLPLVSAPNGGECETMKWSLTVIFRKFLLPIFLFCRPGYCFLRWHLARELRHKADSYRKLEDYKLFATGQLQNNNGWPRSEIGLFATCYKLTNRLDLKILGAFVDIFNLSLKIYYYSRREYFWSNLHVFW